MFVVIREVNIGDLDSPVIYGERFGQAFETEKEAKEFRRKTYAEKPCLVGELRIAEA